MQASEHPDADALMTYALWGSVDAQSSTVDTEAVATHLERTSCVSCAGRIAQFQSVRDVLVSAEANEASPALAEAISGHFAAAAAPPGDDIEWLLAAPVFAGAGVRGFAAAEAATADRQLSCDTNGFRLGVLLHPQGTSRRFAVTGQVVLPDDEPATGVSVTLFLNRQASVRTCTDGFGEFEFDAHEADRFGVRLGDGPAARHVEVWSAEEAA